MNYDPIKFAKHTCKNPWSSKHIKENIYKTGVSVRNMKEYYSEKELLVWFPPSSECWKTKKRKMNRQKKKKGLK